MFNWENQLLWVSWQKRKEILQNILNQLLWVSWQKRKEILQDILKLPCQWPDTWTGDDVRTVTERLTDTGGHRKRARERERETLCGFVRNISQPNLNHTKPSYMLHNAVQVCTVLRQVPLVARWNLALKRWVFQQPMLRCSHPRPPALHDIRWCHSSATKHNASIRAGCFVVI